MGKRFNNGLKALIRPFGILTLVLLLLSVLVWFVGPLITIGGGQPLAPASVRLAILLLLALIWGITGVVLRVRRQTEDQQLLDAARHEQDEQKAVNRRAQKTADAKFSLFAKNARAALRLLRGKHRHGLIRGKQKSLPRYLVIGPAASGKTTMLHSANLAIHRDSLGLETHGDDPAQFVVTEQGLFIEISPLYLKQQTAAHERVVWRRMLNFIRRLHPYQPVNGILLAMSVAHLLAMDEEQLTAEAELLRRRLDETNQHFHARTPIYVVLTQLDSLMGFEEYFAALNTEERNKAFCIPLGSSDESTTSLDRLNAQFGDLVSRLRERQLRYLQAEADGKSRLRAFEFPDQFALLEPSLGTLISKLSAPSRFSATPILRGIFFTSAIQSGPTRDQLTSVLTRHFGLKSERLAPASSAGIQHTRPFFISGLFHGAILAEPTAGGYANGTGVLRKLRAGSLGLLAILVALVFVILWWRGYDAGRSYTTRLPEETNTASTHLAAAADPKGGQQSVVSVTGALDSLQKLTQDAPTHWTFGLYSSTPVHAASQKAYARGLEALLLPRTTRFIKTHLEAKTLDAVTRFELLKLYLILGGKAPPDATVNEHAASNLAAQIFPGQPVPDIHRLAKHLAALATVHLPDQPIDESLVDHARAQLTKAGLAQVAYDKLATGTKAQSLPDWRIIDHIGAAGSQVLARVGNARLTDGIAGLYTEAGYRSTLLPESSRMAEQMATNLWVMGQKPSAASAQSQSTHIRDGILNLYTVDTIRHWDHLLASLTFTATNNAKEAARLVALITNKPSPVEQLLTAIAKATDFAPHSALKAELGKQLPADRVSKSITEHYAALANAVSTGQKTGDKGAKKTQLNALLAALQPLYAELNQLAGGADPLTLGNKIQTTLDGLGQTIQTLPDALQPLFERLLVQTATVTGASLRGRLAQIWKTTVLPQCQALVDSHYPFDPKSKSDASLADFTTVFGPKGTIASFRQHALKPYIDTTVKPWKWRTDKKGGPRLGTEALASLERADEITKAYFDASGSLKVQFLIKPQGIEGPASAFQLDSGGSEHTYAYGPSTVMNITWPSPKDNAKASLSITPEVAGQTNAIVRNGPWAVFRLLETGEQHSGPATPDATDLRFSLGNRAVRLQVSSATAHDFIGTPLLKGYTCPRLGP